MYDNIAIIFLLYNCLVHQSSGKRYLTWIISYHAPKNVRLKKAVPLLQVRFIL